MLEQRANLVELRALCCGERLDSVTGEVGNPVILASGHFSFSRLLVR